MTTKRRKGKKKENTTVKILAENGLGFLFEPIIGHNYQIKTNL